MAQRTRFVSLGLLFVVLAHLSHAGPGAAGGNGHTAILMPDGTIWAAGGNSNGEIGDGTTQPRLARVQVLAGATSVAAGSYHNVAAVGGQLFGWGNGTYGQLGDPTGAGRLEPTVLPGLSDVTQVAAGHVFSLALHADGTVHVFGNNFADGVGDGTTSMRPTPVLVSGLADAVAIAAGTNHALALRADGSVVAWGNNALGKLGDGTTTTRLTPVAVSGLTNIVAIAAGQDASLALDSAGHVWAWGGNASGFLGQGTTTSSASPIQIPSLANVSAIAAGRQHAVALVGTTVWTWGANAYGQLGIGYGPAHSLIPVPVAGLNAIGAIGTGPASTFAFATDHGVWGWGDNPGLGDGTTERRYTPIVLADGGGVWRLATPQFSVLGGNRATPVTVSITSATAGATVRYTTNGAIPTESDAPVPMGGLLIDQPQTVTARSFLSGREPSHAASQTYTFSVLSPTISPGSGTYTSARSVTLTNQTSGAVVRYTLDGTEPTLASAEPSGPIAVSTQTTLKAKAFRGSWTPSSTNSASYAFTYGTLPTPTATPGGGSFTTDQTVTLALPGGPGTAVIRYTLDGQTPHAGSPLYTAPLTVASTTTLKARAFHPDYTLGGTLSATYALSAATPTFTLTAGDYPAGQTVAMATATPNATIRYTLTGAAPTATDPIFTAGFPLTVGNYTLKAAAFRTGFTTSAVAAAAYTVTGQVSEPRIATGATHTLVLKRDGTVWGTGSNGWGHLGDASTTSRTTLVPVVGLTGICSLAAGATHSAAVGHDGRLYTWGANGSRQLGDGTTVSHRITPTLVAGVPALVAVAAGQHHTLALTSTGEVYAFGANAYGQIGNAAQTTAPVPVLIAGLPPIAGIAAGDNHSLAWTSGGELYAWGANGSHQLGDGLNSTRTAPVLITAVAGVAQAAAGANHTLVRTTSGEVRGWGRNVEGQLADGTTTNRATPALVAGLTGVVAIGAGANHSLASTASTTYTWGANGSWQLGDNATPAANRTAPFVVAGLAGSVQLGGGTTHSASVETGGAIWLWGGNSAGQLGTGSTSTEKLPVPITGEVATPTATPGPGTYTTDQSVTLSSATPGATIRYTLTGVDPVETDPVADGPIAIIADATLKAKAWKTPLTPSAVLTAGYQFEAATPTISEPGRMSTTPLIVTLATTTAGATIHYTLDGTPPGPLSPQYGAALVIAQSATLKAVALKAPWNPSAIASETYVVVADVRPPTITARVRPGLNAAGWTMGPATVTFICHDAEGPVQGCPVPVIVPDETNSHPFTATVTDAANNQATVSGVVKVDATPPVLALTSPVDGLEVSTPFVTLSGTASDAMSGLAAVRCNDVLATVSNGIVTCDVPLRPGRNPVVLQASDAAGHSTSIGIVVWRTAALDRLTLSPQQLTLHEGDEQPLRLVNNMGRVQTGATWSVDAPAVIEVVEDGEPTLRALAPGTATVTATVGAFTAQSTITVVGATVVFAPGTTRWLVQATPGQTLDGVIYTHQTSPDVPEAVLVESLDGAHLQLRGVSDGAITSLTPVSGAMPIQTMGDSFGGVLLVQEDEAYRTSLQRVGFTPEVLPWRWVSSGGLGRVVQIHDGTIFATERVTSGGEFSGRLTAASVVVIDGSTGTVRARVPIPTWSHRSFWISDGSSNCAGEDRHIEDVIGLSDQWALTTADSYGVIAIEHDSESDNCSGPESRGHINEVKHLFAVDRDGQATLTQLSQTNWVWPSASGNFSTPEATGLAADARGNFVVTFANDERQLFGPNASGPALPIDDDTIVSGDGRYARQYGEELRVFDESGQLLWTDPTPATPVAFATGDRPTVFVRDGGFLRETGPGASLTEVWGVGSSAPDRLAYAGTAGWFTSDETSLAEVSGLLVETPRIQGTKGTRTAGGSSAVPEVVNFVTLDFSTSYLASQYVTRATTQPDGFEAAQLTQRFYLKHRAHVSAFLEEVKKNVAAVAFFGHSVTEPAHGSIGLWFPDRDPLSVNMHALVHPPSIGQQLSQHPYLHRLAKIQSQAKIVFIGSCDPRDRFKELWDITASTPGRALVVSTRKDVRQGVAGVAWLLILKELLAGHDLHAAVNTVNDKIPVLEASGYFAPDPPPGGILEQWEVVGGEQGTKVFLK